MKRTVLRRACWPVLVAMGTMAAGCATTDEMEGEGMDRRDESFVGPSGKADGPGGALSADQVDAVLALVNTASFEELDRTAGVGLDVRAARGIVDYREGPDGILGTGDDGEFDSLEELDAIPYVGPYALAQLTDYAARLFDGSWGDGPPITLDEALAHFDEGGSYSEVGEFFIRERYRRCDTLTGCQRWSYRSGVQFDYPTWLVTTNDRKVCHKYFEHTFRYPRGTFAFRTSDGNVELLLSSDMTGRAPCDGDIRDGASCTEFSSRNIDPRREPELYCNTSTFPVHGVEFGRIPRVWTRTLASHVSHPQVRFDIALSVTNGRIYGHRRYESERNDGRYMEIEYVVSGLMD